MERLLKFCSRFDQRYENKLQRAVHRKVGELQANDGHSHIGGMDELFSSGHESEVRVRREVFQDVEFSNLSKIFLVRRMTML